MPVKPTSVSAYIEHIRTNGAKYQREKVFECVLDHGIPINRNQIEKITGIRINAVCGRVNELLKDKIIRVSNEAVDPEGSITPVEYLVVNFEFGGQLDLI